MLRTGGRTLSEEETFRRRKPSNQAITAVLLSLVMLSFSLLFIEVLPSNAGENLVEQYIPERSDILGLSNIEDIEISQQGIVYMASYEYVQRFSISNDSFLTPLQMNITHDSGMSGAIDISILGEGWGAVLFAGDYQESMVRYLDGDETGNYTTSLLFDTSNAAFTRVANSWTHDRVFLGTNDKGVGFVSNYNRNVTFLNTSHGLPYNQVTALKVRGNYLLIGTSGGFALYDIISGQMVSWTEDDYGGLLRVSAIEYFHTTETVYIGNSDGLFIYRRNGDSFDLARPRINSRSETPLPDDAVASLEIDTNTNRLYIGTEGGLSFLDLTEDTVVHQMVTGHGLDNVQIRSIRVGSYGHYLYLGTTLDWVKRYPGSLFRIPLDYDVQVLGSATFYRALGVISLAVVPVPWAYMYMKKRTKPLTEKEMLRLIGQGEGYECEFKETLLFDIKEKRETDTPQYSCIRTIAAFMNTCGGVLFIGVTDAKELVGLDPDFNLLSEKADRQIDQQDQFELRFERLFEKFKVDSELRPLVRPQFKTLNGKCLYVVQVRKSAYPVYIRSEDLFVRKTKKGTKELHPREVRAFWESRDRLRGT